jgi:hypothetical protein
MFVIRARASRRWPMSDCAASKVGVVFQWHRCTRCLRLFFPPNHHRHRLMRAHDSLVRSHGYENYVYFLPHVILSSELCVGGRLAVAEFR